MLVKKIKWVNNESKYAQDSKYWRKIQRAVFQNLEDLTNLLIKLAVKARAKKTWNTNNIPNDITVDIDRWKSSSSLYPVTTEDQFQVYSKKKLKGH